MTSCRSRADPNNAVGRRRFRVFTGIDVHIDVPPIAADFRRHVDRRQQVALIGLSALHIEAGLGHRRDGNGVLSAVGLLQIRHLELHVLGRLRLELGLDDESPRAPAQLSS